MNVYGIIVVVCAIIVVALYTWVEIRVRKLRKKLKEHRESFIAVSDSLLHIQAALEVILHDSDTLKEHQRNMATVLRDLRRPL